MLLRVAVASRLCLLPLAADCAADALWPALAKALDFGARRAAVRVAVAFRELTRVLVRAAVFLRAAAFFLAAAVGRLRVA